MADLEKLEAPHLSNLKRRPVNIHVPVVDGHVQILGRQGLPQEYLRVEPMASGLVVMAMLKPGMPFNIQRRASLNPGTTYPFETKESFYRPVSRVVLVPHSGDMYSLSEPDEVLDEDGFEHFVQLVAAKAIFRQRNPKPGSTGTYGELLKLGLVDDAAADSRAV